MIAFDDHPHLERCPKCDAFPDKWEVRYVGRSEAFGTDPLGWVTTPDHLEWSCPVCGYSVWTATADAKEPVPA